MLLVVQTPLAQAGLHTTEGRATVTVKTSEHIYSLYQDFFSTLKCNMMRKVYTVQVATYFICTYTQAFI